MPTVKDAVNLVENQRLKGVSMFHVDQSPKLPELDHAKRLKLFSGFAHVGLAEAVSTYLGIQLGQVVRQRFADSELYVQFKHLSMGAMCI